MEHQFDKSISTNYISFVLSYFLRREQRNYYFSIRLPFHSIKNAKIYMYIDEWHWYMVTKVSATSIMRILQRKMVTQKKEHRIVSWQKMYETDGNVDSREGWKKWAKLALESRYGVAVLTGYSDKMMVTAMGCAGINVGCINFTSIYVIGVVVVEQFDAR